MIFSGDVPAAGEMLVKMEMTGRLPGLILGKMEEEENA
jgi:hypothetical protein